jgi:hypothetical protein
MRVTLPLPHTRDLPALPIRLEVSPRKPAKLAPRTPEACSALTARSGLLVNGLEMILSIRRAVTGAINASKNRLRPYRYRNGRASRSLEQVSKDTDLTLRTFLGSLGMKKGDLSKFVEDAVRWRVLQRTIRTIRESNAGTDPNEIQRIVDEAVSEVRAEAPHQRACPINARGARYEHPRVRHEHLGR